MNADLSSLLGIALMAVLAGLGALVLLVRRDLAPIALRQGCTASGVWFLGAALGLGVIAFSIKLIIILTLATFPQRTIAPLTASVGSKTPPGGTLPATPPPAPYGWQSLPATAPAPADNPLTVAKVSLGERLFHDPLLSRDRTISCSSCHDVINGAGTDGRPTSQGIDGAVGSRNAPTIWNAAFQAVLFWDGRAGSLEQQAMGPPLNPAEMGMASAAAIEARIATDPSYGPAFAEAFGPDQPITFLRIAQAIASYERTLISRDSAYDRFVDGDENALDARQRRGMWLFQSIGCVTCHVGANFSGASNIGPHNPFAPLQVQRSQTAMRHHLDTDKGRAGAHAAVGVWRIPSLRNVALTPPYFHNGSVTDLAEAVRVMASAQLGAVLVDDDAKRPQPRWNARLHRFEADPRLVLGPADINDLVAFLGALSSDAVTARIASSRREH